MLKQFRSYTMWFLSGVLCIFAGIVATSMAAAPLIAQDKTVQTVEDSTGRSLTLSVTGGSGTEVYSYAITQVPAHGTVTLSGKTASYVPTANFNGTDSFQYQVTGSIHGASNVATITMNVSPRNDTPTIGLAPTVSTNESTPVIFAVSGSDIDGDALTCSVGFVSGGTATVDASGCLVTFTPYTGFISEGSVDVRVFDGSVYSSYLTVSITVLPVNEAPVANDLSKTVLEDQSTTIVLSATDADKDTLSYRILSGPEHGSVVIVDGAATYTPATNFNGSDAFTYVAHDGQVDSNIAMAAITVSAVNDVPNPVSASYETHKNQRLTISLEATDADGDPVSFGIGQLPANGRVIMLSEDMVEYLPDEDFVGTDSFEFWANDGIAYPRAMIMITITELASVPAEIGQVVWDFGLGDTVVSGAPAFDAYNRIYFGSFVNGTDLFVLSPDGVLIDQLDIGLRVESSPMVLGDQLIINTLGTTEFSTSLPGEDLLGGTTLTQRLGTISLGLFSDGSFDLDRIWTDDLDDNGRDGSPGRNEDGSIIYVADVFRIGVSAGTPHLAAIDSQTGVTLQAVTIPGWSYASPLFLPDLSTPSLKDGLVVVGPEVDDHDLTVGGFGGLGGSGVLLAYAVDENGVMGEAPLWSIADESAFDRGASAATVNGQTLLFTGTQNGVFYAVRPEDGSVVWRVETGGSGFSTVVVGEDNHTVYATIGKTNGMPFSGNTIYSSLIAFNGETGDILWTHTIENISAVPIVGDNGIYVLGLDKVLAVNEQGQELWSLPLEQAPYYGYASLMPETGLLVFAAGDRVMAVQTESTGPSMLSAWPSYRATPDNGGVPQQ